jgi:16S rRNA (guanine527-N7)-methyltransferase
MHRGKGSHRGINNTKVCMNHIAGVADFERAFGVSRETLGRLEIYAGLLQQWQKTINLFAPSTLDDVWHRHFSDSAQLIVLAPAGPLNWLDLGSGGGFPGLVAGLLLAERGGCRLTLVESDGRKCAFLREVVRQTGLGGLLAVDILAERIETAANTTKVSSADVISARALAPLERLLGWCQPYFGPKTVGLLPKGRDFEAEIVAARKLWAFDADLVPSQTQADGRIVVVRALRRL